MRRLSMNDYELTVYGSIVFWRFFLETALSIPGIVAGVVESQKSSTFGYSINPRTTFLSFVNSLGLALSCPMTSSSHRSVESLTL